MSSAWMTVVMSTWRAKTGMPMAIYRNGPSKLSQSGYSSRDGRELVSVCLTVVCVLQLSPLSLALP